MKTPIIIFIILTTFGCKTNSFIGHYKQTSDNYSELIINSDSSFSASSSNCLTAAILNGKWTTEGKLLHLFPIIPYSIYFDNATKKYRYKSEDTLGNKLSSQKPEISTIKVFADITTDYSNRTYKIKKNKLYQQYSDNGKVKYSRLPFKKIMLVDTLNKDK